MDLPADLVAALHPSHRKLGQPLAKVAAEEVMVGTDPPAITTSPTEQTRGRGHIIPIDAEMRSVEIAGIDRTGARPGEADRASPSAPSDEAAEVYMILWQYPLAFAEVVSEAIAARTTGTPGDSIGLSVTSQDSEGNRYTAVNIVDVGTSFQQVVAVKATRRCGTQYLCASTPVVTRRPGTPIPGHAAILHEDLELRPSTDPVEELATALLNDNVFTSDACYDAPLWTSVQITNQGAGAHKIVWETSPEDTREHATAHMASLIDYHRAPVAVQLGLDKAMEAEWQKYVEFNAVVPCSRAEMFELSRAGHICIPTKWVLTDKNEHLSGTPGYTPKGKARLVACGNFEQMHGEDIRADSPTAEQEGIALICRCFGREMNYPIKRLRLMETSYDGSQGCQLWECVLEKRVRVDPNVTHSGTTSSRATAIPLVTATSASLAAGAMPDGPHSAQKERCMEEMGYLLDSDPNGDLYERRLESAFQFVAKNFAGPKKQQERKLILMADNVNLFSSMRTHIDSTAARSSKAGIVMHGMPNRNGGREALEESESSDDSAEIELQEENGEMTSPPVDEGQGLNKAAKGGKGQKGKGRGKGGGRRAVDWY
ncbi:hypothetical protein AK812_SmicGene33735 [Symbiodinium microadriaticum]|uniref:Uncharacterized protein n=1 Tax=Symbiodinium microadriaticum TaxID=2951 RepID=A0A1Q9CQV1_SYMMI|nr:hypothetical protein AK812_SmicGene33735 [Symbiodinium microadriaticum]